MERNGSQAVRLRIRYVNEHEQGKVWIYLMDLSRRRGCEDKVIWMYGTVDRGV